MLNGKQKIAPTQLPFVQVISDPKQATEENPNGVVVATNMRVGGKVSELTLIQILSEAIHLLARGAEKKTAIPIAPNIVLPDGSPAPMPANQPADATMGG